MQGQESDVAAPVPVLPLEYAPPPAAPRRTWRRIGFSCLALAWPVCLIAVLLIAAVDTESVLVTGPLLFTLGLLCLLAGVFTRDFAVGAVGGFHCFICVLFLVLVNAYRWSPRDAKIPFFVMGTIYTLAVFFPTLYALMRERPAGLDAPQR